MNLSIVTVLAEFESDFSLLVWVYCMTLPWKKASSLIGSKMSVVTFYGYLHRTVILDKITSESGCASIRYLIESFLTF